MIFASAVGLSRLPVKAGLLLLGIFLLLCSVSVARELSRDRTQIGEIAQVVIDNGQRGDTVVLSQTNSPRNRLLGDDYEIFAYPTLDNGKGGWYDYKERNLDASPLFFADELLRLSSSQNNIWLIWIDGFETYGINVAFSDQN